MAEKSYGETHSEIIENIRKSFSGDGYRNFSFFNYPDKLVLECEIHKGYLDFDNGKLSIGECFWKKERYEFPIKKQ
jgi:hypothetical protein